MIWRSLPKNTRKGQLNRPMFATNLNPLKQLNLIGGTMKTFTLLLFTFAAPTLFAAEPTQVYALEVQPPKVERSVLLPKTCNCLEFPNSCRCVNCDCHPASDYYTQCPGGVCDPWNRPARVRSPAVAYRVPHRPVSAIASPCVACSERRVSVPVRSVQYVRRGLFGRFRR